LRSKIHYESISTKVQNSEEEVLANQISFIVMSKTQATKKQHYVPECYLKQFLRDGQLYTLDIKGVQQGYKISPRINYPGRICYLEDFYTISADFPNDTFSFKEYDKLFVENVVLQNLERKYPVILNELINGSVISAASAYRIADFMVSLKLRNPNHLSGTLEKNKDEWIDKLVDQILNENMKDTRFASMSTEQKLLAAELVKKANKENPHFSKQMMLFSLIRRASDEENSKILQEAMLTWPWTLLIAPEGGPYFITTDCPGFASDNDGGLHSIKLRDGFAFHLPLTPQYCLLISDMEPSLPENPKEAKIVGRVVLDKNDVYLVNDRQICMHNRLLIADEPGYLSEIARLNKPKIQ
jgi:hypothetical protein